MDRRKFLGWLGKATAVAVVAPQVLAEASDEEPLHFIAHPQVKGPLSYSWDDNSIISTDELGKQMLADMNAIIAQHTRR